MFGINLQAKYVKKLLTFLIAVVLASGLVSCSDRLPELPKLRPEKSVTAPSTAKISEVSPPEIIQQLRQAIDVYQPQVKIQSPQPNQIFPDNTINVQLQVQDLPIFKSGQGLGPYLEVILDNKPYTKIYDLNQSLILSDLEAGTHTLRVFACRPWDESFKNEGAYAQTTFHIFTKTSNNNPAPNLPLLTYNTPVGSYGAEPIMLDFYLTNAPLHFVAQEDPEDEIVDWRIRVTVNGTSFITDQWQPMYLQGFEPGKNWVKLEYIDELGNPLNNFYNNTARLITYQPDGQDPLSKIIRGEISLQEAFTIVDPNYIYEAPQPEIIPEAEETPAVIEATPEPEKTPSESIEVEPQPEEIPVTEPFIQEAVEETPETQTTSGSEKLPVTKPTVIEEVTSETEPTPSTQPQVTESQKTTKEKMGEFMNRFRRRFKGKETVTSEQEKPLNGATEIPTSEVNLNLPPASETQELLEPNEPPTLPEIVEEAPVPTSVEEAPQETPSLTPNSAELIELPEVYTIPEVENSPLETTPELEEVGEQKAEFTEESFVPKTVDSEQTVTEEIKSENTLDSAPNITD